MELNKREEKFLRDLLENTILEDEEFLEQTECVSEKISESLRKELFKEINYCKKILRKLNKKGE